MRILIDSIETFYPPAGGADAPFWGVVRLLILGCIDWWFQRTSAKSRAGRGSCVRMEMAKNRGTIAVMPLIVDLDKADQSTFCRQHQFIVWNLRRG